MSLNISQGIIIGAAIGDALGAPIEFLPPRDRDNFHKEMTGGGVLQWKPGQTTDDTQMTSDVSDMYITKGNYDQEYLVKKFLAWKNTNPKDIGAWTHAAISEWEKNLIFPARGNIHPVGNYFRTLTGHNSGNGGVMRCMPTAIVRRNNKDLLFEETYNICEDTHPADECILSCLIVNAILADAYKGTTKKKALTKQIKEVKNVNEELADKLSDIKNLEWDELSCSGYTIDTLIGALWAWLKFDSFENGLIEIVNRGNDSDTVGAVAGALLGAYHGFNSIPVRWLEVLENKDLLIANSEKLHNLGV